MGCYITICGAFLLILLDVFVTKQIHSIPYHLIGITIVALILVLSRKEKFLEPLKFVLVFSLVVLFDIHYLVTSEQYLAIGNITLYFLICFLSLVLFNRKYRLFVLIIISLNLLVLFAGDYQYNVLEKDLALNTQFARYFFIILLFGMGDFVVIYLKSRYEQVSDRLIAKNNEIMNLNAALEKKVDSRTEQLSDLNRQLSLHLYRSSHDFKRPLTTLLGIHEVARLEQINDESMELFDRIHHTVHDMDHMLVKFQML